MIHVSLTRLRLRSIRFLPVFAIYAVRTTRQVKRAPGYCGGAVLPDEQHTYWTMTAWDSRESMLAYMTSGAHRQVMPKLMHWCDEASVAHWDQEDSTLPAWEDADKRMRSSGRASKVHHPSPGHAALEYPAPRITRAVRL
jgi:heme-degrading monooxygenase HmoA